MTIIEILPYTIVEAKDYEFDGKIVIRAINLKNIAFQDGRITYTFKNCRFKNLEIENTELIDFKNISLQFVDCFIYDIKIETFLTTNCSILFFSSIFQGRIKNRNLIDVTVNNCLLHKSLFLLELNKVVISYTEENIFPLKWGRLFKSINTDFSEILKNIHKYHIHDCKDLVFSINESSIETKGFYKRSYWNDSSNKLGYYFTENEKMQFKISLNIQYSAEVEHKLTKIINAKLFGLAISGYYNGILLIENSKVDNFYLHDFSTQGGVNIYNLMPFRTSVSEKKFEIHKSSLDKFWFDNVSFDDYSIISLHRNKFGLTTITSCNFPSNYNGFEKFKTVENIHYPDRRDKNYYKTRYEIFLQLKKVLEASGNIYEAQKFQAVSNDALAKIEDLPLWDKVILQINSKSNYHGLSIKRPLIATVIISVVFYIIYLFSLDRIFNTNTIDFNLIGYYFSFLDITHRSDFLVDKAELNGFSLTMDYFNKLLIGFFIYQFISAFRKYGK